MALVINRHRPMFISRMFQALTCFVSHAEDILAAFLRSRSGHSGEVTLIYDAQPGDGIPTSLACVLILIQSVELLMVRWIWGTVPGRLLRAIPAFLSVMQSEDIIKIKQSHQFNVSHKGSHFVCQVHI